MRFPDKLDVLTIHARLIEETGGSSGLRDQGSLESAQLFLNIAAGNLTRDGVETELRASTRSK